MAPIRNSVVALTLLGLLLSGCGSEMNLDGLSVIILPENPGVDDDLQAEMANRPSSADDEDFRLQYIWFQDDTEQTDLIEAIVPADRTRGGETWRVVALPTLGVTTGTPAQAEITLPEAVVDVDGDGYENEQGDGADCDDNDPDVHPGAAEVCNGIDDDCNEAIDDGQPDNDEDGFDLCLDCDDDDGNNFPGNIEVCDEADNDCDLLADEEAPDNDGDGADACADCDDTNPNVHPGAAESCGGTTDDDCDGSQDPDELDLDGDGSTPCDGDCNDDDADLYPIDQDGDGLTPCQGDCDDQDATNFLGNAESCDGLDEDCSGTADDNLPDIDLDGFSACDGDCDDEDFLTYPGAPELCDALDNDCDEEVPAQEIDSDGDGFTPAPCGSDCDDTDATLTPGDLDGDGATTCGPDGTPGTADDDCDDNNAALNLTDLDEDGVTTCGPDGLAGTADDDCNDEEATVYGNAPELCDEVDNDCDGSTDEDLIFISWYRDNDSDGAGDPDEMESACDGAPTVGNWVNTAGDCDDSNSNNYPGNAEVCDANDNDCDNDIDEDFDLDGDGHLDQQACSNGQDCDDRDASQYPEAPELCNLEDDDCDQSIDEGFDNDNDNYFSAALCPHGEDCDDTNNQRSPIKDEICDGLDNDCDDSTSAPGGEDDSDNDTYLACADFVDNSALNSLGTLIAAGDDCDDLDPAQFPGATELCNSEDDNCDTFTDEGFDTDSDGYFSEIECPFGDDCNDGDDTIHPGIVETCDLVDNDCDGSADEDFDADGDGFFSQLLCSYGDDCDDTEGTTYPDAPEGKDHAGTCDDVDNDCDGGIDEGFDIDGDSYLDAAYCPHGDDCADNNPDRNPGETELCDLVDNDCDSAIDEDFETDGDGVTTCGPDGSYGTADDDCDDDNPLIYGGAPELCDSLDNDCNFEVDDNIVYQDWFPDSDGDGYGNSPQVVTVCDGSPGPEYTLLGDDCDDNEITTYPNAPESCDVVDNDCDLDIDEDFDVDLDSFFSLALCTFGTDCDDNDANQFPGAQEVCNQEDDNCNLSVDENFDGDLDGYFDAAQCPHGEDCNDTDATFFPGATELCDLLDNDCDDETDEGFDADGDSYFSSVLCSAVGGDDCDDADPTQNPGAPEVCNHEDDNCTGGVDEGFDVDADGYFDAVTCSFGDDCDDDDDQIFPGAPEVCDLIDNDCEGGVDEDFEDDGDGVTTCGPDAEFGTPDDDCDDENADSYPDAPELCDGEDNDCDGTVDDNIVYIDWYLDSDGDGYGDNSDVTNTCDGAPGPGYAMVGDDCVDTNAGINPGASETCDQVDNNCDTTVDEGFDADGDSYFSLALCSFGDDCDDADINQYPGASEACNEEDDDCDSLVDENFDADGDGYYNDAACSYGDDCNDTDAAFFPGAAEVCDQEDNDCDTSIDEGFDSDGDGYYDSVECPFGDDCDDDNATHYPGAPELCNEEDDNCESGIDEGFDSDSDGYFSEALCPHGDDCDDTNPSYFPGASELCDAVDNDCDSLIDDPYDQDGDGVTTCGADGSAGNSDDDCDDTDITVYGGAPELCDGQDNDCNGSIDDNLTYTDWYQDVDGDGYGEDSTLQNTCAGSPGSQYVTDGGDCDDNDSTQYPTATELCNGADDDCDGSDDNGLTFTTWYQDNDGDGAGDGAISESTCDGAPDAGYVLSDNDCNDSDANLFPGNLEICDGQDNDCDIGTDEEIDGDGDSYDVCDGDCDDANAAVNPGVDADSDSYNSCQDCLDSDDSIHPGVVESPDNGNAEDDVDNDCDGVVDEYNWAYVHAQVILPNCGCHQGASHSSGMAGLSDAGTAYSAIVNVQSNEAPTMDRIEPFDSAYSYLWHKISGTHLSVGGSGAQMPLGGPYLDADTLAGVQGWIDTGAAQD